MENSQQAVLSAFLNDSGSNFWIQNAPQVTKRLIELGYVLNQAHLFRDRPRYRLGIIKAVPDLVLRIYASLPELSSPRLVWLMCSNGDASSPDPTAVRVASSLIFAALLDDDGTPLKHLVEIASVDSPANIFPVRMTLSEFKQAGFLNMRGDFVYLEQKFLPEILGLPKWLPSIELRDPRHSRNIFMDGE